MNSMPLVAAEAEPGNSVPLIGLAALTRAAMRGEDLGAIARRLVARLAADPRDAAAFLDLSTIEQLLGAGGNRAALQAQALQLQRVYAHAPATTAAPVLLVLLAPGDFMANTPIEFLLEGAQMRVEYFYVDPEMDIAAAAPPHDAAFVAVAESQANRAVLAAIARAARNWPRPLLNPPDAIARLTRDGAWRLLHEAEGVTYPRNLRLSRQEAFAAARELEFPFILRPVDSHAGAGLEKIEDETALANYLQRREAEEFYAAPFVDYRGPDRLFRKMRVAFVDGAPFPVHLAISPRWMIHYLNADMRDNVAHRVEEAHWMENFADFVRRHARAFASIRDRLGLDYFLIDCAECGDDSLLIFEIGSAMIAHDLDCPQTFPYKSAPMRRLFAAFQDMVVARAGSTRSAAPA